MKKIRIDPGMTKALPARNVVTLDALCYMYIVSA